MTEQTTKRVTKSLWAKLAQAQAAIEDVPRRGVNPMTRSTYVRLDDLLRALKPALIKAGLTVIQAVERNGEELVLNTILADPESGETFKTLMPLPEDILPADKKGHRNAAQDLGAGITYARRYALASLFLIASDEDTDAEAHPRQRDQQQPQPPTPPKPDHTEPQKRPYPPTKLKAMLTHGIEAKKLAGFTLPDDRRSGLRGAIASAIDRVWDHHEFASWLGIPSSASQWDDAALETLRRWLGFHKATNGSWQIDGNAGLELAAVAREMNPTIPGLNDDDTDDAINTLYGKEA